MIKIRPKRGTAAALLSTSDPNMNDHRPGSETRLIDRAVVAGLRTGQTAPSGGLSARQLAELREALTRAASDVGMSPIELSDALERAW